MRYIVPSANFSNFAPSISGKRLAHANGHRRAIAVEMFRGDVVLREPTAEQVAAVCQVPVSQVRRLSGPVAKSRGRRISRPVHAAALWNAMSPAERATFGGLVTPAALWDGAIVPCMK
jgi:hypothetical protein